MSYSTTFQPGPVDPTAGSGVPLRPLTLGSVRLDPEGLLGSWQERNARATLPHCVRQLDDAGALGNLRREPADGARHIGLYFSSCRGSGGQGPTSPNSTPTRRWPR